MSQNFKQQNMEPVPTSGLMYPFLHFQIQLIFTLKTNQVLYTSGPVSLKERLLYTLNKLFVKQVKSFLLLLDLDPSIPLSSSHNIKYIKFTSP